MSGYLKTVRAGLSWGYGKLFGKGSEPPESGAGGENTSEVPEKELGPVAAPASNAILLHFDYVRSPVPRVQVSYFSVPFQLSLPCTSSAELFPVPFKLSLPCTSSDVALSKVDTIHLPSCPAW